MFTYRTPVRLTHPNGSVLIAERVDTPSAPPVLIKIPGDHLLESRLIREGWTVHEIEKQAAE